MTISPLLFVLVLFSSAGLVAFLTPLAIRWGRRFDIVDIPGGRRQHEGRVVRLGGLFIYPAFLIASVLPLLFGIPRNDPLEVTRLTGVLIGMGIVWVMGLADDSVELGFWPQFVGLLLAALVAIHFKVFIEIFNNPFTDGQVRVGWYLMVPITLVWIVGMSATVNMLDGLDGLATGVVGISALVFFVHMLRLQQYSVSLLPLALLGCCVGFLPYNFNPARIFLGGGAHLLGYAIGTLSIIAGAKVASGLLLLWVPILDVMWQIYSRWKRGQSIGRGDRGHLHFRLQDAGYGQRQIVFGYCAITAVLGLIALLVPSRLLKLAVLIGAAVIIFLLFILLTRKSAS
ncbi:MAG: MraY family glycosyltransferase [Chloroflexota bacterium]|nr:MraY family glycosyltransferase [Chloroflexota bacterium]